MSTIVQHYLRTFWKFWPTSKLKTNMSHRIKIHLVKRTKPNACVTSESNTQNVQNSGIVKSSFPWPKWTYLGITPRGDVVDRDLRLPACRTVVVESWGNDIGNRRLQKINKSTCFGVNYGTQKMLCCYMNLNKINYPFNTSFF